jgi:hypothetical protein
MRRVVLIVILVVWILAVIKDEPAGTAANDTELGAVKAENNGQQPAPQQGYVSGQQQPYGQSPYPEQPVGYPQEPQHQSPQYPQ